MRSVVSAIWGAIALALLFPAQSEAASGVTTSNLNLRLGPATNYHIVATMPAGTSVEVGSCEKKWCQVRYGELTGWSFARYLKIEVAQDNAAPAPTAAEVQPQAASAGTEEPDSVPAPLTDDELEVLAAPIALYPDELVALVIAASLYPVDIVMGARFLEDRKKNPSLQPSEDWDGSVVSLLNYPGVVKMMSDDLEWTQMLAQAALNQQKDLLVAIQQLRDQAVATNVLKSTEQVLVTNENENVVITSADPEVIYVPQYEPEILYDPGYVYTGEPIYYSEPYPSYWYPYAGFWAGAVTGAAFAALVDWDDWGTWGGDVDIDIDYDGDNINIDFGDRNNIIDRGDRNFDRDRLRANRDALRNADRSKMRARNLDRSQISRDLRQNRNNRVNNRQNTRNNVAQLPRAGGNDVRKNVQSGLRQRQTPAQRPAAQRAGSPKQSLTNRKPSSRRTASRAPNRSSKSISSRRPGSARASRPSRPSSMGRPSRGKRSAISSSRGRGSYGGGMRGGRSGGGRSFSRGGRRR